MDEQNPWFGDWYRDGFAESVDLAGRAEGYAGYVFSIKYYLEGFQDGHLGALAEELTDDERLSFRWPGFLVEYVDGLFRVAPATSTASGSPPAGARLLSCDGVDADEYAELWLRGYVGLWSVVGSRPDLAPYLLIDAGNPFIDRPSSCVFEVGERRVQLELGWREIDAGELKEIVDDVRQVVVPPIGIRPIGGEGYWITLSSFNASVDETDAGLQSIIEEFTASPDAYRNAGVLVFDVRGNGGGNSGYGSRIASALWGQEYVSAHKPRPTAVDWRSSPGNARFLREFNLARSTKRFGPDDQRVKSYERFVEAVEEAAERGDEWYTSEYSPSTAVAGPNPVSARVFFLTDSRCKSACLGFADIMVALPGVTHVGRETSADAIFIDNRSERLPSGLGRLGFSMKVYRGRFRGHNESYQPALRWKGRIDDTSALEAWILEQARGD